MADPGGRGDERVTAESGGGSRLERDHSLSTYPSQKAAWARAEPGGKGRAICCCTAGSGARQKGAWAGGIGSSLGDPLSRKVPGAARSVSAMTRSQRTDYLQKAVTRQPGRHRARRTISAATAWPAGDKEEARTDTWPKP